MKTAVSLSSLYAPIEAPLEQARQQVREQWTDAFQLVYGPGSTPPRLGGKLLRPALCFLAAGASGAEDLPHFTDMATAMELLHLASLAHDDVVDSAHVRRGEASLNRLWDNHTAVLGGDYLVARALDILTRYDSTPVIKSALESIHEMAEGELINFGREKGRLNEDDCLRLARKKTASLFAVACATPALIVDATCREPLHEFGLQLGTAFQLIDDLLDLEQDEATLGKPSCGDVSEGKTTLPILYLKESMDPGEAERLEDLMGYPVSEGDRTWVRARLKDTGVVDRVNAMAHDYVQEARDALSPLPQSAFIEAMLGIAEFVLSRDA